MSVELKVPSVGESVVEAQVGAWLVEPGQPVARDQPVVVVETDKASVEIAAPVAGRLTKVLRDAGAKVKPGEVLGVMEEGAEAGAAAPGAPPPASAESASPVAARVVEPRPAERSAPPAAARAEPPRPAEPQRVAEPPRAAPPPKAAEPASRPAPQAQPAPPERKDREPGRPAEPKVMPAADRLLAERQMAPSDATPTGPGGRLLKEDVQRAAGGRPATAPEGASRAPTAPRPPSPTAPAPAARPAPSAPPRAAPTPPRAAPPATPAAAPAAASSRSTESVPMSPLRKTVARRLVEAQRTAALLTTFNEIDMSAVAELRRTLGEAFLAKHGVKLGLMSFFVKAVVDALAAVPAINAQVKSSDGGSGDEILYHHYCDVGIAVGGGKGLVVPVIRNAERLAFAEVERQIADFAKRAQENRLTLEELSGGTFTISNGGIYGSLLSTPIVNPPQSGVLGLHAIQERPVARGGQVVIRPMMYVALTYDHRLVDGREAVTFLKRVKECVESPPRILLDV